MAESRIVRLGNGWAYNVGATTSEPFATREEATAAAAARGVDIATGHPGSVPPERIEQRR